MPSFHASNIFYIFCNAFVEGLLRYGNTGIVEEPVVVEYCGVVSTVIVKPYLLLVHAVVVVVP